LYFAAFSRLVFSLPAPLTVRGIFRPALSNVSGKNAGTGKLCSSTGPDTKRNALAIAV
jgi:hypothetical protein